MTLQTVAAVALGRVGRIGTDQRRRLHDQVPALPDGAAERIAGQCVGVRHIPVGVAGRRGAPNSSAAITPVNMVRFRMDRPPSASALISE